LLNLSSVSKAVKILNIMIFNKPTVAIIGGGISGLACAYELAKAGKFEVHIYEKDEILGGRLFDIFAGRIILNEQFHNKAINFTKELGIMKEMDEITPADLGIFLPNGKIISGKSMKFYLLKEFIFRRRSFKLFSESFKFIRYAQSLEFDIDKYESNLKKELKEMSFEKFRSDYSPEVQQFVIDPVQMMISPDDFGKISAEVGLYFSWVIYALKKGYFMSKAPVIYAEAFTKVAKKLGIVIHLESEVKKVGKEEKHKIIFSDGSTKYADVVVSACPLSKTGELFEKDFGIDYSFMRAFLIKGRFRYKYPLSLSAFPESNVDLIYNWGEYQVFYPQYNRLKPISQDKTPIELNIDCLYKGEWEFVKEIRSSVGIPFNLHHEIPSLSQGDDFYICGDFYGYPGIESAVHSGFNVAEKIIKSFQS
jgi:hypothetical protein